MENAPWRTCIPPDTGTFRPGSSPRVSPIVVPPNAQYGGSQGRKVVDPSVPDFGPKGFETSRPDRPGYGRARSVGDDLAAVQGVIPAQPVTPATSCQVTAAGVPYFSRKLVRDLVEKTVEAGLAVQLCCRFLRCSLGSESSGSSCPVDATHGNHGPGDGPAGVPEETHTPAEASGHFLDFRGQSRVNQRSSTASVTHSAQL